MKDEFLREITNDKDGEKMIIELRNMCAISSDNQTYIRNSGLFDSISIFNSSLLKAGSISHLLWQLLANGCAGGNVSNAIHLWSLFYPRIILDALTNSKRVQTIAAMSAFVNNCLLCHPSILDGLDPSFLYLLIKRQNELDTDGSTEIFQWIYSICRNIILSKHLKMFFPTYNSIEQLTFIQTIDALVTQDKEFLNWMEDAAFLLVNHFHADKWNWSDFFSVISVSKELSFEHELMLESVRTALDFFAVVTSKDGIPELFLINIAREGLLVAVVQALHVCSSISHPNSFKCQLIRIIGNLAFNNLNNQNWMRELGVLELLLNNTNLDENNPHLREWSVFALRNMLKENEENQNRVKVLQAQGVAHNSTVEELGYQARFQNGKVEFTKSVPC